MLYTRQIHKARGLGKGLLIRTVRTNGVLFSFLFFARTTPNPAHQRADGLDPTKQADQNQRKLVTNMEARLNKVCIMRIVFENVSRGKCYLTAR